MTQQQKSIMRESGFVDPVLDSQKAFRIILDAMARPGKINSLGGLPAPPAPLFPAAAAVCLTLLDMDTPLWLDQAAAAQQVRDYLRFETGCPLAGEPAQAVFGLIADAAAMPALSRFAQGSAEYPDRSASLIIQVGGVERAEWKNLARPGHQGFGAAGRPRPAPDGLGWPAG